jgi:hypothetical protein
MPGAEGYINDPPAAVDADSTNETNDSVIALLKAIKNLQIDLTELNLGTSTDIGTMQADIALMKADLAAILAILES